LFAAWNLANHDAQRLEADSLRPLMFERLVLGKPPEKNLLNPFPPSALPQANRLPPGHLPRTTPLYTTFISFEVEDLVL